MLEAAYYSQNYARIIAACLLSVTACMIESCCDCEYHNRKTFHGVKVSGFLSLLNFVGFIVRGLHTTHVFKMAGLFDQRLLCLLGRLDGC